MSPASRTRRTFSCTLPCLDELNVKIYTKKTTHVRRASLHLPQRVLENRETRTPRNRFQAYIRLSLSSLGMGKSSTYRGVTLFRPTSKWRAQVRSRSYIYGAPASRPPMALFPPWLRGFVLYTIVARLAPITPAYTKGRGYAPDIGTSSSALPFRMLPQWPLFRLYWKFPVYFP